MPEPPDVVADAADARAPAGRPPLNESEIRRVAPLSTTSGPRGIGADRQDRGGPRATVERTNAAAVAMRRARPPAASPPCDDPRPESPMPSSRHFASRPGDADQHQIFNLAEGLKISDRPPSEAATLRKKKSKIAT